MKTLSRIRPLIACGVFTLAIGSTSRAGDMSPADWPKADRERLEVEGQIWYPLEAQTVETGGGIVSATVSPVAVYAGTQALRHGGNAADAAITTALTQVTTQLGSIVSYAGIFTMLYYDAKSHRVYSMDAGFNSYLQEIDPKSIPVCDLNKLPGLTEPKPSKGGAQGRKTLVPGFMAGVEDMHHRFGHLPFSDLFEPAIWYAQKGIRISPILQDFFESRAKYLSRTEEGRQFIRQAGGEIPKAGNLFVQAELARTLKAISENGSQYMYTGDWGMDFVKIVQREGGRITAEDMRRYKPIWSEPYKSTVFGHTVYANGPPHTGAYGLLTGLNCAEALKLDQKGPYWTDPKTFQALSRIGQIVISAPYIDGQTAAFLKSKGIDISADAQLGKDYARAVAPLMDQIFAAPAKDSPKHSNAIVVVDRDGNIAVVTHTINTVTWGDTGIVVDGIPIPDSAGYQQLTLASINPGDRVPHQIIDSIAFDGDRPVLATASVGTSLALESIRVLVGVLGQHQDLATVLAAPALLMSYDTFDTSKATTRQRVSIPKDAYDADFVAKLELAGLPLTVVPFGTAVGLRGTLAAIAIDPKSGKRTAVNCPGVIVFNGAE